MRISRLLNKNSIIANLNASDKKGAIDELASAVSQTTDASAKDIATVLMEREQLGSTGIGGGIAIPHGKLDSVGSIIVGFGLSPKGIEYESLDNKPVHIFFLLLTTQNSTGDHLKVLAQISKLLKMDHFKQRLLTAESVDEIYNIIMEQDEDF
ncbi:PTS sugar transporter subunit IIA [Desulfobacula toluolica]|uniref:Putative PTS IIA-like nitrogen-regulatory protein n=1 Tax=Desulfobacula toluolica (strain DSM 7467 / Tol2) TaxID=651182 RepID=K0N8W0_DESTT|nr:PTS sugar transporter subunit IIA [Desulfobacula toluolica]CCK80364.1 putative PTS IIA-like nitrogen-regulatory protein [Desulfobacula toluolica Tol2]